MPETPELRRPWLIAVWPGMGQVAISAGYFLMSKLDMFKLEEFSAHELFDVEDVEVRDGLIHTGRLPRNRLFARIDPEGEHDLLVLIGEAQPPSGKYAFCRRVIDRARALGVERVLTFAAMATEMHPEADARVFCAATEPGILGELRELELELEILQEGRVSGMNGVLLGVAAEQGLVGACLLGEMPHILSQIPYPKASVAVLRVFATMSGIDLDLSDLVEQAQVMEQRLGVLLARVEEHLRKSQAPAEETEVESAEPEFGEPGLSPEDEARIESLFEQSARDRSRAYELKTLLDELGRFEQYEDRFLDLFQRGEESAQD